MPHAIDFDDLEQKLFIVQQLCNASEPHCRRYGLNQESNESEEDWIEYSARLKSAVSNYMIECAIKTRVTQDFLTDDEFQDIDLSDVEERALDGMQLGQVEKGNFQLTLRESCNKVIHALEAGLIWVHDESGIDFWPGAIRLGGKYQKRDWVVLLEVETWSRALRNYHSILQHEIDWMSVWEYDE